MWWTGNWDIKEWFVAKDAIGKTGRRQCSERVYDAGRTA